MSKYKETRVRRHTAKLDALLNPLDDKLDDLIDQLENAPTSEIEAIYSKINALNAKIYAMCRMSESLLEIPTCMQPRNSFKKA